jgi:3-oxoacyl-[acyl-carrier-protein] synthase II
MAETHSAGSWVVTGRGLITALGDTPEALSETFAASLRGEPALAHAPRRGGSGPGRSAPGGSPSSESEPGGTATQGPGRSASGGSLPVGAETVRRPPSPLGRTSQGSATDEPRVVPTLAIRDFQPKTYLQRKGLRDLSRISQLACAAASRLAGAVAGIEAAGVGVVFGSAWGSLRTVVDFERAAAIDGPRFVDPLLFTETVANLPAGQISIFNGWSAFNVTVSAGTASGLEAIGLAIDLLSEGRAEIAVAGGGDEISLPILFALHAQGSLADSPESRPFAPGRSGAIGGEGAGLLLLEETARAEARGASALAQVLAVSSRTAAGAENAAGAATIEEHLRALLDRAGTAANEVDLLILSGSGRPEGDAGEATAVMRVFGTGASAPAAVAPKALLGETWGASGPLGVCLAIETMRTGIVPGRDAGHQIDRAFHGLNLLARTERRQVRRALVLDSASPGHIAGLVVAAPGSLHGA